MTDTDTDQWIFLSGMMGTGKTSVGRRLARRLGTAFVDLDARLVEEFGMSVGAFFQDHGEAAFRQRERASLRALVSDASPCVVALGGGTVTQRALRHWLLSRGKVVCLEASVAALTRRLASDETRPLLQVADRHAALERLYAQRQDAYAEAHLRIETEGRSWDSMVDEIVAEVAGTQVLVPLGTRSYRVHIGAGVRARLTAECEALGMPAVVAVTDENVDGHWGDAWGLGEMERARVVLPPGEKYKVLASVEKIWNQGLETGLDRHGLLLALGGGVVGDMTGFAAATLYRGVHFAQMPTTLLSMVDASVGGKTGFDRPEGKNLVGSFYQPRFVLCDPELLSTLPPEEYRSGLAEVVKSGWLDGEASMHALERQAEALVMRDPQALHAAIEMSVRLKARIVAEDELESGRRKLLNFGHTVGHAIEAHEGFEGMRHGDAVALGMVAAFDVAQWLGIPGAAGHRARLVTLLAALGLPHDWSPWRKAPCLAHMTLDKKRAADGVHFIVPGAPGQTSTRLLRFEELIPALLAGV